ncbi:hypothetical protein Tco_0509967, partial [Tanacetum coccineum]
MAEHGAAAS